jgi:serine protease
MRLAARVLGAMWIVQVLICGADAQPIPMPQHDFVPGELLVGYNSEQDREVAAAELRVRGAQGNSVTVEKIGPNVLKIRIELPRGAAGSQLGILENLATALKESDSRIKYAHPNWIMKNERPEKANPPGGVQFNFQSFQGEPRPNPQQISPNDPAFQMGLHWDYLASPSGMNAIGAWQISTAQVNNGIREIVVAVLDTGILYDHPDMKASANLLRKYNSSNVLPGYSFVLKEGRGPDATDPGDGCGLPESDPDSWHGTHVAGTIGAVASNNGFGMTGIGWHLRVLPVRVLGKCGSHTLADVVEGIYWAAGLPSPSDSAIPANPNPADVINMSLGGLVPCENSNMGAYADAIQQARKAGAVVVAAAGNGGFLLSDGRQCRPGTADCKFYQLDVKYFSPASCPGVISVAAADREGRLARYSNFGAVTIMAPGGDVRTWYDDKGQQVPEEKLPTYCRHRENSDGHPCFPGGILSAVQPKSASAFFGDGYGFMNGTSQAAPHVSAAFALVLAKHPDWRQKPDTADRMTKMLKESAAAVPAGACPDDKPCGAGLLDAAKLLAIQ